MTINLGLPALPPPTLAPRRKTRKIKVGKVDVGGDAPISVQSMTTTLTSNINATLQQIAELTATGCDIVRVAVPSQDDADALPAIAHKSQIPVIADIHFQPKYVFAAIEAGCAAVRVNPGNIRAFDDQVKQIAAAAKDHGTSIRIGVNAGSLDKRLLAKYGKATPEALVESALWEASLFEEHDFREFKISVKHNDPVIMVRAYELLSESCDYPLHLGVTEAGPAFQGTIKLPAEPGDRRHHPRLALRPAGRGGQGRAADPAVAQPAAPQARDRLLPLVRSRAGRRLHARRAGHGRARGHDGPAPGRGHGLRRERSRRGPRS
jgi:(E)-4-hydroxy-3-methylbut-2-enyl-diphosphate synthase